MKQLPIRLTEQEIKRLKRVKRKIEISLDKDISMQAFCRDILMQRVVEIEKSPAARLRAAK